MKRLLALPLSVKLLAPAGVALLCLVLYLAASVTVLSSNNDRLQAVRDVHFPVLDSLTRNVARLDDIINGLNGAVAAGDADMLEATGQIADAVRGTYTELQATDPGQAGNLATLGKEFDAYYASAHAVAMGFIDPDAGMDPEAIEQMTARLEAYRGHLTQTHEQADARFRSTVQTAVDDSSRAMVGGVVLGLLAVLICIGTGLWLARAISRPLVRALQVADAVANGRLDADIRVEVQDEGGRLLLAMARMQDQLRAVIDAQTTLAAEHDQGNISHRIDAARFPGEYGRLVQGTNTLVDDHVDSLRQTLAILQHYSVGDFSLDMPPLPGAKAELSDTVAGIKANLQAINAQIQQLAGAAANGDFSQRGDSSRFAHAFAEMVDGLNTLMDTTDHSLADLSGVLQGLAQGDLTVRMAGQYRGVFAHMREDADAMVKHLTGLIGDIRQASSGIAHAASEISAGNSELSGRTERQAASLEETAASMEELTATVQRNAEQAQHANRLAGEAGSVALQGGQVVREVVGTMAQIEQSSRRIADIISVIDGIAFQTNILALNAAVEAARAGEQGRGFAVVASEVRSLAQRSADASKEITTLINESVARVSQGAALVQQAGSTMERIVGGVQNVGELMSGIAAASQEQSSGIGQVNQTVVAMDQATQQNAALVEEVSHTASELSEQTRLLNAAIGQFRLTATT